MRIRPKTHPAANNAFLFLLFLSMVFLLIMQMFCIAKIGVSVNNVVIKSEKYG